MFDNNEQFEDFIESLPLTDKVNHQHKEQLERMLLEKYVPATKHQAHKNKLWSSIMNKKLVKIAAAAVIIIALSIIFIPGAPKGTNSVQLLENVCNAENSFFNSSGITHITTEIRVYPLPVEFRKESVLDQNVTQSQLYGPELWFRHNWLPSFSLKSDGQFRTNQLKIDPTVAEGFVITDDAWYDPITGYFKRIMDNNGKIVMANTWDGTELCEVFSENGQVKKVITPTDASFKSPANPAGFLGLAVGICQNLSGDNGGFNLKYLYDEVTEDGKEVQVYRSGFEDVSGNTDTYWLLKIEAGSHCLAEMEFYLAENLHLRVRRVLNEKVAALDGDWSLAETEINAGEAGNAVSMNKDMYIENVTVAHMVEKATYPTYAFKVKPQWCQIRRIFDIVDPPSPGHRMFILDYFTENNPKHVMLIQCKSYNGMFVGFLKDDVDGVDAYIKTDKYRVYRGGPQEKWWTKVVLDSCSIEAQEDREGYLIWTGTETIPALVINGATTADELKAIIDTLITGEDYVAGSED